MARRFTLELIMDLASRIGANPAKAISRSNVSFLGKGPTKNPLFQAPLAGLENAKPSNLGKPETLFAAIDDAVGWMKDGKLNSIQSEILGHNLKGIEKIINPPPLPMASVTAIRPGIEGLRRFPKETHKFMGRPLKDKDFAEIDELVKRGRLPETGPERYNRLTGAGDFLGASTAKTGMSRAIARQILLQDKRIKLPDVVKEDLLSARDLGPRGGGMDPLDLMKKYYGQSVSAYDDFLNQVNLEAAGASEFAEMILKNVKLVPQFAEGGLARILEV